MSATAHQTMTSSISTLEDADIPECLSDDEFKRALEYHTPHLRAFARSLCGCRDRADDLAQDAILRAWGARERFRAGTNFKAWIFTILRNHFYSEARRARFVGEYDEDYAARTLRTDGAQDASVQLADVLRALAALPASHREALILVAVGDLSYEEISAVCGIALGTVKSRICRARAMLTHAIESGQLPDFRHNFVIKGEAIDALFAELGVVANALEANRVAA